MLQLAEIFEDGMILQCRKPVRVWGYSQVKENIYISINNDKLCEIEVPVGKFSITLPAQEPMENATLQIGNIVLREVDFGEVWIAGGQSNMEFLLRYDVDFQKNKKVQPDEHIRYYEVGKYQFQGEKDEGVIGEEHWDKWLKLTKENAELFSAIAYYFALKIRKKYKIPVGIVSCNYGGTTASSWMDQRYLTDELQVYLDEYKECLSKLNMEEYYEINKQIRHGKVNPESRKITEAILYGGERIKRMMDQMQKDGNKSHNEEAMRINREMMNMIGPNDKNRPGGLYESMLIRVKGFTLRGVLWYQGETDQRHPDIYGKLFASLIACWRRDWEEELPFLFVQLAPFGTWMGINGERFPIVRKQQEMVANNIFNTYMISSSDVGDCEDIHPKKKKPLGHRLALVAMHNIYGETIESKYPKGISCELSDGKVKIIMSNGTGLYLTGTKINDIKVLVDSEQREIKNAYTEGNCLVLEIAEVNVESNVYIKFACTGFYEVNLYNKEGIPAIPFELTNIN